MTGRKVASLFLGQVHHALGHHLDLEAVQALLQVLEVGLKAGLEVILKVLLQVGHHVPIPASHDLVLDLGRHQYPVLHQPETDPHQEGKGEEEEEPTPAPGPGNW